MVRWSILGALAQCGMSPQWSASRERSRVSPHGQHVLPRRDVPRRDELEIFGHAGVVTPGKLLGFGGESVTAAHGNTLRVSQWYAKWSGARGTRPVSPEQSA